MIVCLLRQKKLRHPQAFAAQCHSRRDISRTAKTAAASMSWALPGY
jgi:hypothetical protein